MEITTLKVLGERALELIFPIKCPVCLKTLNDPEKLICKECYMRLKFTKEPICKRCGRPLKDETAEFCEECEKSAVKRYYEKGVSLLVHDEGAKKILYDLKYSNIRENIKFLAREFVRKKYREVLDWNAEALIPVPLHKKRYQTRGFNQAELFAKELGRYFKIPVDSRILQRQKATTPQKELDKKKRKKNIENSFKISDNIVKYKCAILVDDIFTTGATINECAKMLRKSGVERVYFITASIVSV